MAARRSCQGHRWCHPIERLIVSRSHAEYVAGDSLTDMIKEDLVAERIAIDSYREAIQYLDDQDPTTRRMLEGILAGEEQHADELADLLLELPMGQKQSA